jgi:hypothetical protein
MTNSKYTIENNKFFKFVNGERVEFRSLGSTLYPAHSGSGGVIERAITNGILHGKHTLFRSVLMFEGYKGSNPLKANSWKSVKTMLQIGKKYNVGITVEVGSALISWLERQNKNPYDEEFDKMFEDVIKKACKMYRRFATSSLFAFTIINESGPYKKKQEHFDSLFRRMQLSAALIKEHGKNEILVGSGGLLHLSQKSGGIPKPFPSCPWINNGETKQVYWKGVYTCPGVDFNMIHIYANSIATIESNNSEWSNLESYYNFCSQHGKPLIVDEFGMKLQSRDEVKNVAQITVEGISFLRAIQKQLAKIPIEKVPPIIEFWNLNSTCGGFDWWPESSYHNSLFVKEFQDLKKLFFASSEKDVDFNPKTFQLEKTQKVIALDSTLHIESYHFKAKKLGKQNIYVKEFSEPISLLASDGICFSITNKIPEDHFNMKIRFHLGLQSTLQPNEKKKVSQSWNSLKQNDIIPTSQKNEMFVDFSWGDIQEFGSEGLRKGHFVMESIRLELICLSPKNDTSGNLTIKNIRLATK